MNRAVVELELARKRTRLELYYKQEEKILTNGVQSYGIGSRSLARYNTALAEVRTSIKELEEEVKNLEGKLNGTKPRKAVGVIPRDL